MQPDIPLDSVVRALLKTVDSTNYFRLRATAIEEIETDYQVIEIVQHLDLGKLLFIDCDVMSSDRDDAFDRAYTELIPSSTKSVLILGGGDCSLAHYLQKTRPEIQRIKIVDIDGQCVDFIDKHFGWKSRLDSRTEIVIGDAFEVSSEGYDVIVDDLVNDPYGLEGCRFQAVAERHPGKTIITHTKSRYEYYGTVPPTPPEHPNKIEQIAKVGHSLTTIERWIPCYLSPWTFTRFVAR